jgi:hypothetical protein
MPLQKLQFRPGVNREGTSLSNEGGWFDCDKIRFRSGYPEKIGGWAAISYNTFLGVCRSLWNWVTLKSFNLVGVRYKPEVLCRRRRRVLRHHTPARDYNKPSG